MSVSMYRSSVERLTRERASLERDLAQERAKAGRLQQDVASILRGLSGTLSLSTLQSRQQQLAGKQRDLGQVQGRIADLEAKIASKLSELHRQLTSLTRAEQDDHRRAETDAKRRRDDEMRHTQAVTREVERQARLGVDLRRNRLVIDLARLPVTIKVLFVAANPLDQGALRLDEEQRAVTAKIRASEHRDAVTLVPCVAARPGDLLQALNEHRPHVVHFSGHGSAAGELVFQGEDGGTKLVTPEAIVATMRTLADDVRLVVFNACFSRAQAEAVTRHVDAAIGMDDAITDEAARLFAAQFYSAVGFGRSVRDAFDQARAALMMESVPEEDTPQLYVRDGVDAGEIILVRP